MKDMPFESQPIPNEWDRSGLPAWTYRSDALFALERDHAFLNHWQVVGHVNDVPSSGDWLSFDMLGERAVVMRGQDGTVRAFHNLCRHRGARVVDGKQGQCRGSVVCPFHGWVYNLDGTLRGAAQPDKLPPLDPVAFGLDAAQINLMLGGNARGHGADGQCYAGRRFGVRWHSLALDYRGADGGCRGSFGGRGLSAHQDHSDGAADGHFVPWLGGDVGEHA